MFFLSSFIFIGTGKYAVLVDFFFKNSAKPFKRNCTSLEVYKHQYIQSLQTIMKFCWSLYYSSSTVLWQGTCHTRLLDMTMIYDIYAFSLLYLQNAGEKLFGERKKWKDYNIPHFDAWDITSRCYMSAADARYPGNWRFISIGPIPSNCYDRNMVLVTTFSDTD